MNNIKYYTDDGLKYVLSNPEPPAFVDGWTEEMINPPKFIETTKQYIGFIFNKIFNKKLDRL